MTDTKTNGKTVRYYGGIKFSSHIIEQCLNNFFKNESIKSPNNKAEIISNICNISFNNQKEFLRCYEQFDGQCELFIKLQGSSVFQLKFTTHGTEIKINSAQDCNYNNLFKLLDKASNIHFSKNTNIKNKVIICPAIDVNNEENTIKCGDNVYSYESFSINDIEEKNDVVYILKLCNSNIVSEKYMFIRDRMNYLIGYFEGKGLKYQVIHNN